MRTPGASQGECGECWSCGRYGGGGGTRKGRRGRCSGSHPWSGAGGVERDPAVGVCEHTCEGVIVCWEHSGDSSSPEAWPGALGCSVQQGHSGEKVGDAPGDHLYLTLVLGAVRKPLIV